MGSDPTRTATLLFGPDAAAFPPAHLAYYSKIDELVAERRNSEIENTDPKHALYLIYHLVEIANSSLQIFTGQLAESFSDGTPLFGHPEIAKAFEEALNREVTIQIVVLESDTDLEVHPLVKRFKEHPLFSAEHISDRARSWVESHSLLKRHFILVDEVAYRLEIDHDTCEAAANFGDAENGNRLSAIFRRLQNQPSPA